MPLIDKAMLRERVFCTIQRLWRDEGLRVPCRKRKKPHRCIGAIVGATCPIVPTFTCGFVRSYFALAIVVTRIRLVFQFTWATHASPLQPQQRSPFYSLPFSFLEYSVVLATLVPVVRLRVLGLPPQS